MSAPEATRPRRRRTIVVGFASIVAIALAAATITSATSVGGFGAPAPGTAELPDQVTPPSVDLPIPGINANAPGEDTVSVLLGLSWCSALLSSPIGGIVYFGAFAGLLYGLKRRYSIGAAIFGAYGLSPIVLVAYFMSTNCASAGGAPGGQSAPGGPGGPSPGGTQFVPELSPLVLVGAFGIVVLGAAALLYRETRDAQAEEVTPIESTDAPDSTDVSDLAAAAGGAADRLEAHNADVDNEVYRAWWEMTTLLDVANPHSSTPGEFADAAVEIGMRREDVEELTRLFEEVRYGRRDPEGREERAIEVFRAIEAEYGE